MDGRWGELAFDYLPIPTERRSQILRPFAIPCMQGVLALNVTRGCSHACVYCYARAYPEAPPRGQLLVYENLPARLEAELGRMRRLPRAVSLCTATDPFQPFPSILAVTYQAAEMLLTRGITVTFLTKGFIPDEFVALFARFPDLVRARIGLLSLDPAYHRTFEPGAAPPEVRLGNLRRLHAAGVTAGIRHDPVIPGVTDKPEALDRMFSALEKEGITDVDVGYLYIRPGIAQLLRDELPREVARPLLSQFRAGPIEEVAASANTQLLPPEIRVRSFFTIRESGREHGIKPILCRCKNPDMRADRCQGSRDLAYPTPRRRSRQLVFAF
ncbi:MAG: radical SAM protein [Candidatus Rokubacteria bacterium]|nr:radical SAM protein [Candidatus Rokubacteria bacterium]